MLASTLAVVVMSAAVPAFAQTTEGAGRLELAVYPAGWISFTESDNESAFSEYLWGGSMTVNWSMIALEGDISMGISRTQDVKLGAATMNTKTPHVSPWTVSAVVPLMGNRRRVIPFGSAGIGEVTIMRTSDDVVQPDTETFTTGTFGGGVKAYTQGRWGFRGDYRFMVIRSKFASPGAFFGEELRKSHRVYAGLTFNLIP
jgi:hypothetical protein